MAKATTVDEHFAALAADRRPAMDDLRRTIRAAAPDAVETVAYDMPAFRTKTGRFLVSYAAYKGHYSLFPASGMVLDRLGDEARRYFSGRGTFRFPVREPVPLDLIRRIVEVRVEETAAPEGDPGG
jgi:uncharacterized protein YdhG (YjbR/CyaY superfamily)